MLPWLLWNVYCATDTGMKSDGLHQVRAMREEWGGESYFSNGCTVTKVIEAD